MRIAKRRVLDYLEIHAEPEVVAQARAHLADPVDTDAEGGLLAQLGICVLDLLAAFGDQEADPVLRRPA